MKIPADFFAEEKGSLQPGLYLVGTPIGNLADITLRALHVLSNVTYILCEDTRHSQKLLQTYAIKTPLKVYHEHTPARARETFLTCVREGKSLALISDAGMPLVSDPGYKLVQAFWEEGLPVTVIPGPSASLSGLALSGLPSDRFFFQGFLPVKGWRKNLEKLASLEASLIFFESARRLPQTLKNLYTVFGMRPFVILRELTKKFEERLPGMLSDSISDKISALKGEITLVVSGCPAERKGEIIDVEIDAALEAALRVHSLSQAVKEVSGVMGVSRSVVYQRALTLQNTG